MKIPVKSTVSFFRKELGFKGKTRHNGRGVYEMELKFDKSLECDLDIEQRIRDCLKKWTNNGWVEKVIDNEMYLSIVMTEAVGGNYYRTLRFNKKWSQKTGMVEVIF